ncbi:hypothetical protein DEU56DRAFT_312111 [Suillus clintonianus]|uniref:uncharacterized protein n=1 Tax=Suillus clintonianus TaxID=1904413 RepID=UPI001B884737|nr:uncharacterized protein DEU56DRAFT_312111 [Suillus clintonianus]KAG2155512.1 hypothetical protein DEU56DRAFT_312111 [Suillus clintonianus]
MRYQHALLLLIQISIAIAIALPEIPAADYGLSVHSGRDLLGMLAGTAGTDSPATSDTFPLSSPSPPIHPGLKDLGGLLTDPVLPTASSVGKVDPATPTSLGVTSSAGSLKPSPEQIAPASATRSASYPAASSAAMTEDVSADNKTWKIIGIVFITILIIAIAITSSMFFDRWWKVAQEILCCKGRRDSGIEQFVPDWEKQTWEVKLGPEERDYRQRASFMSVRSDTRADHVREGEINAMRNSADHTIPTLPPPLLRVISPGPSDTRELPWDADNLHKCALHRQLSARSGHHGDT